MGVGASRAPRGLGDELGGERSFGDAALRGWIEKHQPDVVLSGHVHQSPFARDGSWADQIGKTWVFNAGHQMGPLPSHVVVDTAAPDAYWISLAAKEFAPLNQSATRPFSPLVDPPRWLLAMAQLANHPSAGRSRPAGV